jgi:hypothetical protein
VTWVEDVPAAQRLLDAQLQVHWPTLLNEVRGRVHPSHPELLGKFRAEYYWSLKQSEWASDVLFEKPAALQGRYGNWLRFALTNYTSADVLRFLGRKLSASGEVHRQYTGEVLSDLGRRVDGVRIKHRAGDNSIKMYDKAAGWYYGSRPRSTTRATSRWIGRRKATRRQAGTLPMARVADLHRRAEVSQAANERYLRPAAVDHDGPLKDPTDQLGRRVGSPARACGWRAD